MADDIDFSGLAGNDQRNELLRQQLAQAMAMFNRSPMQGYGALGGLGAGLANLGNGVFGALMARNAREGLQENASDTAKVRQQLAQALMGGGQQAPAAAPPSPRIDATAGPTFSPGAHPLPVSMPVQEPGAAQLAGLGLPPQVAHPPAPSPMPGATPASGGAAPSQPSGIDALAALGQKAQEDRQRGIAMLMSGDPVLAKTGEALVEQSQREQQMGLQTQLADAAHVTMSPMGNAAIEYHPLSGRMEQIPLEGVSSNSMIPYAVGSRPFQAVADMGKAFEQSLDFAHAPGSLQQDVTRLQLGQNLQGAIQQAEKTGWSRPMRQMVAGELQKLVNGVAGSEGELKSSAAQAGVAGSIQDIYNALTGDISGPQLDAYTKFVKGFAGREHQLAYNRLSSYIDGQAQGGIGQQLRATAPKLYEATRDAAIQKLTGLGDAPPAQPAAGMNLDGPAGPTHYLVSPDGKMRIAADANGKPLPGAQPEPINGG